MYSGFKSHEHAPGARLLRNNSTQGLISGARRLHLAAQGLHLAAQGLHLGAQGLYLAAQGLYSGAQGLLIMHMGQMLYLAGYWLAGGPLGISKPELGDGKSLGLGVTNNNNLPT